MLAMIQPARIETFATTPRPPSTSAAPSTACTMPCVRAVPVSQPGREGNASQGGRRTADQHPTAQWSVHRPEAAMAQGAEGLEDGTVGDIRANGESGLVSEQEHQDRRH